MRDRVPFAAQQGSLMNKKTYTITNMECPNCAMLLESIEEKLPGIQEVRASYHTGRMTVVFDETKVSEGEILAEVEKKGYKALP